MEPEERFVYIRKGVERKKRGVILLLRFRFNEEWWLSAGWSLCRNGNKFSASEGREIARKRALRLGNYRPVCTWSGNCVGIRKANGGVIVAAHHNCDPNHVRTIVVPHSVAEVLERAVEVEMKRKDKMKLVPLLNAIHQIQGGGR